MQARLAAAAQEAGTLAAMVPLVVEGAPAVRPVAGPVETAAAAAALR